MNKRLLAKKLTFELQQSQKSILKIALNYDYESPDTFTIACKNIMNQRLRLFVMGDPSECSMRLTYFCLLKVEIILL